MLKRLFYKLTGGRPMIFIKREFIEHVSGKYVNLYRDKLNRKFLATHKWSIFRVQI